MTRPVVVVAVLAVLAVTPLVAVEPDAEGREREDSDWQQHLGVDDEAMTLSPPLCPFWSHHRCDAGRCLRYEVREGGEGAEACSQHCVRPAPTCLHRDFLCDGVSDCEDGSDERGCVQCALGAFPCDGECRRLQLLCEPAYSHCRPADVKCPGRPVCGPGQGPGQGVNVTCDGVVDCAGGRDERACGAAHDCQAGSFFCDGRCVRESRRCDGVPHCQDGSDEAGCPVFLREVFHTRETDEFVARRRECFDCGNGRCLVPRVKCDGVDDCGNGRDEKRCFAPICSQGGGPSCVATACSAQGIPCFKNYRCGRSKWRCDSHPHCEGGADERPSDCLGPPKVFWCEDGAGPLPAAHWCDGTRDCEDGADELSCPSEPPAAQVYCRDNRTNYAFVQGGKPVDCPSPPRLIHCYDGTPRLESTRCDGVRDCPDGEDEDGCDQCYDGAVLCDGRCLMASRRCDGYFDCSNGADERGCKDHLRFKTAFPHPDVHCGPARFDCSLNSKGQHRCIDPQFVCDGADDCENRADEANCLACREGAFMCGGRCVRRVSACPSRWEACLLNATAPPAESGQCDGVPDCADGLDEVDCDNRQRCPGALVCPGKCRPRHARCDAHRDCLDGQDEHECPDHSVTTRASTPVRVGHRDREMTEYRTTAWFGGTRYEVATRANATDAVTVVHADPPPPTPTPLPCATATTPEPTTTPELAPTPAPPLRGQRPRKRGGSRGGRRQQQQRARKQRQRKQHGHNGDSGKRPAGQRQRRQRQKKRPADADGGSDA